MYLNNYKKTQQERLLEALKLGPVNSYDATYTLGIKQAPTRIKELKALGHDIVSYPGKGRSVNYVLNGEFVRKQQEPIIKKEIRYEGNVAFITEVVIG